MLQLSQIGKNIFWKYRRKYRKYRRNAILTIDIFYHIVFGIHSVLQYPYHIYPVWKLADIDRQKTVRKDHRNVPLLITITGNARILQAHTDICECTGAVRVARYTFCISHACMNHGFAYVEDRRSIEIPFARGEELASLIRLWRGSCCLARVHNECTIKDCDCVASLYTTYRVRRCANWFRTSQFIFAKVFLAASGCTMITDLRYSTARSLTIQIPLLLFPFPSFSHCTIGDSTKISITHFVIWCKLIFCWLCT